MNETENIKWADHKPAQHKHRISDWSLGGFTHDDGEIGLVCSMCATCWHTGVVEVDTDEDERDLSVAELKRAAARWIDRQQMPLPMVYVGTPAVQLSKRRYTPVRRVDLSAQMSLFALAA